MTEQQEAAMRQALEAITQYLSESPDPSEEAVEGLCDARAVLNKTLTAALEQPAQHVPSIIKMLGHCPECGAKEHHFTTQAREWVGLTDEEYAKLAEEFGPFPINQIEAKLREKNA